jgi:predicted TIM-barrel fold metal-dependent hydrolase
MTEVTGTPVIDVHSHFIPPAYWSAVRARMASEPAFAALATANNLSPQPGDAPMRTLAGRIGEMDDAGVAVSVLSLPPPGAAIRDGDADLVRGINDELIEAARQFPSRLRVLCALPLPDVAASLAELSRVSAHDLVRGVAVTTCAQHWQLDDQEFDVVYQRICELGFPVLAHPALEPLPGVYSGFALTATVSPVVSSTLGVLRMVYGGTLDRVAGLTVIVPHLGGTIPYLMQRLEDLGRSSAQHPLPHYLATNLILDTCSYYPPAFRCALDTVGSNRLALGTDYPFRGSLGRAVADVRSHQLGRAAQAAVLGGNVAHWFA